MSDNQERSDTHIQLTIDGRQVRVPKGTTVYHAAKDQEIDIPIFCYLDRLPPFGACRMCMVQVENMNKPQTSCTLEAKEGWWCTRKVRWLKTHSSRSLNFCF